MFAVFLLPSISTDSTSGARNALSKTVEPRYPVDLKIDSHCKTEFSHPQERKPLLMVGKLWK